MSDHLDDFGSPYFDWGNSRIFDPPTRALIDQIASDPRFGLYGPNIEILQELANGRDDDEQRRLLQAACTVFEETILPELTARATQLVEVKSRGVVYELVV